MPEHRRRAERVHDGMAPGVGGTLKSVVLPAVGRPSANQIVFGICLEAMHDASPPFAILYRSIASQSIAEAGLLDLIERAGVSNKQNDITGLLLHGRMRVLPGVPGGFLQWIEGPEAAVRDLFERIQKDDRHVDVEVLGSGPVTELAGVRRLFPTWGMRMVHMADLPATLEGFLNVVNSQSLRPVA